MNRREFIKRASQIGGLAALTGMGISDAHAIGVSHSAFFGTSSGSGSTTSSWSSWDAKTESGWGSTNTNIIIFDGADSTDETGQGVLTGADLVATQLGSVGAAVSDAGYYYRPLDGTDDRFWLTVAWWNTLLQSKTEWTIAIKARSDAGGYLLRSQASVGTPYVLMYEDATHGYFYSKDSEGGEYVTTDDSPRGGTYWWCIWTSGGASKAGFTNTGSGVGGQPIKLSDFAATKRGNYSQPMSFPVNDTITYVAGYPGNPITGRIYAVVVSSGICLIDNAT